MFTIAGRIALLLGFHERCGRKSPMFGLDGSVGKLIVQIFDGRTEPTQNIIVEVKNGLISAIEDRVGGYDLHIYRPLSGVDPRDIWGKFLMRCPDDKRTAKLMLTLCNGLSGWSVEWKRNYLRLPTTGTRELTIYPPNNMFPKGCALSIYHPYPRQNRASFCLYVPKNPLYGDRTQIDDDTVRKILSMLPRETEMSYVRAIWG